jgi:hypothetical protein
LSNFCLSNAYLSSLAAAQQSDQVVAERVLGPRWKQLSRRAGMIFAGTVLTAATPTVTTPSVANQIATGQTANNQAGNNQTAATDRVVPGATLAVQLRFRVDEAIAGVDPGQILTIHEWAGVGSMQRPMRGGEHILLFLYPLSRLGLTSPVGGSLGQVALDASGKNVVAQKPDAAVHLRNGSSMQPRAIVDTRGVSVVQLERAIRSAREE